MENEDGRYRMRRLKSKITCNCDRTGWRRKRFADNPLPPTPYPEWQAPRRFPARRPDKGHGPRAFAGAAERRFCQEAVEIRPWFNSAAVKQATGHDARSCTAVPNAPIIIHDVPAT